MRKKIIISLILFVLLVGCNEKNGVHSIWNGGTDTEWYKESNNEFTITTAEQLAGFAKLVNSGYDGFEDKVVKLGRNIILNDTTNWQDWASNAPANEWIPIEKFNGTFDGNGYVVSGIYISNSDYIQGLFKYNSGIKDFKFSASYIKGKELVDKRIFTITTPQQLANGNDDNNLNLAIIVSNNYLEMWLRGGFMPKLFFNDMNVYEELANSLTMIHDRFIDSPDFDKIIIVFTNNMVSDEIFTNIMDKVKEAGFLKISLAKIDEEELRKYYENIRKKNKVLKKIRNEEKTSDGSTQERGLKVYGISSMGIRSVSNSDKTGTKVEVSGGTPGEIGNALGNLMSEQMKKERRR